MEERLRRPEPFVADRDDLSVRKFIALLEGRRLRCSLHLLLEVECDVAEFLFDVADDFALFQHRPSTPTEGTKFEHVWP